MNLNDTEEETLTPLMDTPTTHDGMEYLSKDVLENTTPKQIITDASILNQMVESKEMSKEEMDKVSAELFITLLNEGGLGLSTNQIGIPYRACIINVKEPLILINPTIVKWGHVSTDTAGERIVYVESCLSIPKTINKPKRTMRVSHITIQTDNLGTIEFGPDDNKWKRGGTDALLSDQGLLESVVVQHEIGHLDGLLITDSMVRYNPQFKKTNTYSRNEKVMVKNVEDDTTMYIKYKVATKLMKTGNYELL